MLKMSHDLSLIIVVMATIIRVSSHSSNPLLVTEWNKCGTTDNKLRTFLKPIALELCVKMCTKRAHCVGVNYWRRSSSCDLLGGSVTSFVFNNVARKPCVHVSGHEVEDAMCDCPPGNKCSENSNVCFLKECPVKHVQNGKVHGNMQSVGSKAIVICQAGAHKVAYSAPMVCDSDGNWTNVPKCLFACPEPCSRFSHTKPAVGDGLLPGSTRTYSCKLGYSTTNGGTHFTIKCRLDSTWTIPTTYCKGTDDPDVYKIVGCQALYFSKYQMTNVEASDLCVSLGGDLIRIDTEEKQTTVTEYIRANDLSGNDYWIQGTLNDRDKKWYFNDGTKMTKFFWAPGAPDGVNEKCVRIDAKMDDHRWNDKHCMTLFYFICEPFCD